MPNKSRTPTGKQGSRGGFDCLEELIVKLVKEKLEKLTLIQSATVRNSESINEISSINKKQTIL